MIWAAEWQLALRRPRLLVLNVGIPLLLVLPIALGGAPPFHAAAAYAVLFVLFGTFGSAIPLLRDAEGGILRRLLLAGGSGPAILLPRIVVGTLLDTLQLLPAALVILMLGGASGRVWLLLIPTLVGTLLTANLVGVWIAAVARSLAEGALFAAVVSLFLLHGSGVFRTARPGSPGAALESVLPFGPVHQLLLEGAGGAALQLSTGAALLSSCGGALLLGALTITVSGALIERIAPAR